MSPDKHILVVDDDEKIGRMFMDIFDGDEYHVSLAASGESAIREYRKNHFDVVFLDMIMPGMNGLETLKGLKKYDEQVRVVLMTGYAIQDLLKDAEKIGIVTSLTKPFHIDQVKTAADQPVQRSETPVHKRAYNALVIDAWMDLIRKFKPLLHEMGFDVEECANIKETVHDRIKQREFDLILISTLAFEHDCMEMFHYVRHSIPTTKCVMLIDEYMNIDDITGHIKEIFSGN